MERFLEGRESAESHDEKVSQFLGREGLRRLDASPKFSGHPEFVERPVNPEAVERLSPDSLRQYFETCGARLERAMALGEETHTTLFPVAAIQKLEPVFYEDAPIPEGPSFIAQPVIRTQFWDKVSQGTSTSFVNIATEHVGARMDEHIGHVHEWLQLMSSMGIKKEDLQYRLTASTERWNSRKVQCEVSKFYYQGMEIGDGVYIPDFPQAERGPLKVSDVGFGMERLLWILRGGNYFPLEGNEHDVDAARSLALIAASGVQPGNRGREYRHRLYSKRLVQSMKSGEEISKLISSAHAGWLPWMAEAKPVQETLGIIAEEYDRNLRRSLLDGLSINHADVGIDVNLPESTFFERLGSTSMDSSEISSLVDEYYRRKL
ncbi:hypothetical protein JW899_04115 [Candidatus Uhrbacteria bacterium]|nr:hypothetical protein [Candidatus Uhrbacteria bacterium]